MSHDVTIYHLVRNPDQRYDNEEICALTRKSLLDRYPETEERFIQEDALLVPHPYLHPKFSKRLLPADKLYEVLRDEAHDELSEAVFKLGATEIDIVYATDETQSKSTSGKTEVKNPAGEFNGTIKRSEWLGQSKHSASKLTKHEKPLDINSLDKVKFFDELVYNKNNKALNLLFDGIKAGHKFKEYKLEFKHSINRSYKLEAKIQAAYGCVFKGAKITIEFENDYKENKVESATFTARF